MRGSALHMDTGQEQGTAGLHHILLLLGLLAPPPEHQQQHEDDAQQHQPQQSGDRGRRAAEEPLDSPQEPPNIRGPHRELPHRDPRSRLGLRVDGVAQRPHALQEKWTDSTGIMTGGPQKNSPPTPTLYPLQETTSSGAQGRTVAHTTAATQDRKPHTAAARAWSAVSQERQYCTEKGHVQAQRRACESLFGVHCAMGPQQLLPQSGRTGHWGGCPGAVLDPDTP